MAGKKRFGNPVPVSDLAAAVLDPVVRKRTGLSIGLVHSWEEIVGPRIAAKSSPEKLQWPRLQHETSEVMGRINAFLGFEAVDRIRIVQKPVALARPQRPTPRALTAPEKAAIAAQVRPIEDDGLRAALERLGASVHGFRKR